MLLLALLAPMVITVLTHKPPTRQEYKDIERRLQTFDIPRDSLPPGEFLLTECTRYQCHGVTDTSSKFGLACRDNRATHFGITDFIFIYLRVGHGDTMTIRNTDMDYTTMLELVACLHREFLAEQANSFPPMPQIAQWNLPVPSYEPHSVPLPYQWTCDESPGTIPLFSNSHTNIIDNLTHQ